MPIGLLLSTGAVKALGSLGDDALLAGAWRIPFLASIVLVAVGLFIRLRIAEPPAFERVVEHDARARVPLLEVLRRHPRTTLLAMGARISESVTFNVYNAFLVTYVVTVLALENTVALNALIVAAVIGFFVILGAANLSDRIGRRPVFALGAALAAVSAFPIFALFDTKNAALITVAVVIGWAFAACTMFGAEGVLFAELYPTRVRYSGMSTGLPARRAAVGRDRPDHLHAAAPEVRQRLLADRDLRRGDGADHPGVAGVPARDVPPGPARPRDLERSPGG